MPGATPKAQQQRRGGVGVDGLPREAPPPQTAVCVMCCSCVCRVDCITREGNGKQNGRARPDWIYRSERELRGGPTGVEIVVACDETFRGDRMKKKKPKWRHAWCGVLESTRHTEGDDNEYYQSTAAYAPAWRENGGCGVGVDHDGGGGGGSARVGGVHRPYAARAKNRRRRHASTPSGYNYLLVATDRVFFTGAAPSKRPCSWTRTARVRKTTSGYVTRTEGKLW